MNIEKELEQEHSRAINDKLTNYIGDDPQKFRELSELFLNGPPMISQRAAWVFSSVVSRHPAQLPPVFSKMVKKLSSPGNHDGINRNILRILQQEETFIPEKHEAQILDLCLAFIKSEAQAIAIRAFAITAACRICKKYPELGSELLLVLGELSALPQSAAISVRIKAALKALGRSNSKV